VTYPAEPPGSPGPSPVPGPPGISGPMPAAPGWPAPPPLTLRPAPAGGPTAPRPAAPPGGYVVPPAGYGPPPGYPVPPPPRPTAPDGRPLAEFSDRLLAYLIDAAVFVGVGFVLIVPAVIGIFAVISNVVSQTSTDPATGAVSQPNPWAIILPILAIYGAVF